MALLKLDAHRNTRDTRLARTDVSALAQQDVQALVDQLQLQRLELQLQNEELRNVQLALEDSQEQYKELFECAPVGYVTLTVDGAIVRANEAARAMLQHSTERLTGRCFADLVTGHDRTTFLRHLDAACTGEHARCELQLHITPGQRLDFELQTHYVAGKWPHHLMMITDISVRARYLEELQQVNRELEEQMAARTRSEAARNELETRLRHAERLESLGMLAAGVAHDFNNLLVGVLSNADLVLSSPGLPETYREPLSLIARAGRDAAALTRQLLVFAGQDRLHKSAVDLREVIREHHKLLATQIDDGVQAEMSLPDELPAVDADRVQLQQMLANLLANALEAVGPRGKVTTRTSVRRLDEAALAQFPHQHRTSPGEFVTLEVSDTGPGIEPGNLTRIFEPFFTTKFTGRGLGLATVLGIVHAHGGALRVQSQPGHGATFEVALPVAQATEGRQRPPPESRSTGQPSRVMLIDDDRSVRKVVAAQLTALGMDVQAVANGKEAVALLNGPDCVFDLVILDWLMPEISGEQVLKAVRQRAPLVPVVVISGYCTASLGIDDAHVICLQKPFTLRELEVALQLSL